ncbi:hypothetical protein CIB48_g8342 [Xylaria polymorpha]|nr:hypothetical protein CIB48_g8342 [Xylaria polymorpha]
MSNYWLTSAGDQSLANDQGQPDLEIVMQVTVVASDMTYMDNRTAGIRDDDVRDGDVGDGDIRDDGTNDSQRCDSRSYYYKHKFEAEILSDRANYPLPRVALFYTGRQRQEAQVANFGRTNQCHPVTSCENPWVTKDPGSLQFDLQTQLWPAKRIQAGAAGDRNKKRFRV